MEKFGGGWGFGWLCSDLQLEVIVVYELESKIGSVILELDYHAWGEGILE
jgi:hypothetical protein